MKLEHIASNMTQVRSDNGYIILFSYNTPVAYIDTETLMCWRSTQKYSKTTSNHIRKWGEYIVHEHVAGITAFSWRECSQSQVNDITQTT